MLEEKGGINVNSIIGIVLIFLILIGFSYLNRPSPDDILAQQRRQDSAIAQQQVLQDELVKSQAEAAQLRASAADQPQAGEDATATIVSDTSKTYGVFEKALQGQEEFFTIENELLKITISSKGGMVHAVELKNTYTHDSLPLYAFKGDGTEFNLSLKTGSGLVRTQDRYFQAQGASFVVEGSSAKTLAMRLYANDDGYVEYQYTLAGNSYNLDFRMNFHHVNHILASNESTLAFDWSIYAPRQEKSQTNEHINSTIYYKFLNDEVDYITERNDERIDLETKVKWIAFKGQFFSSILTAKENFAAFSWVETITDEEDERYVKQMKSKLWLAYEHQSNETFEMDFYFGPNHYKSLKEYEMDYEQIIPLGWGIFRWVNVGLIIPIFNWLGQVIDSYGIIILIMTIFIKMLLFPLMYKSYKSTAKMRVLKPQVDEINAKYPDKADAMKKQQAVMALYKKTGVNPLGGCLPMLVQFPILIAMYRFFPSSIELRQQGFLWATDLSSYDSIYDFPDGFSIPFYGDHVSLFTLLMTAATLLSVKMNAEMSGGGQMQMPQMKVMMYMMPIMFLGFFNDFAAALSYYYFVATMITFAQQYAMRRFVDEEAILRKLDEHKKKPAAPKSKFQKRLEKMAREKGYKK
ncbi:MAG: membrane protein insertase YidC [Flavobacteriales bacterium]|nr:membrane protein insertase YidC [Flavobacteriales bacterium]